MTTEKEYIQKDYITARIKLANKQKLIAIAQRKNTSVSLLVAEYIEAGLKKDKKVLQGDNQ